MADGKEKNLGVQFLSPHDQRMVQEPRSEWTLTPRPPIAFTDLTGGVTPPREGIPYGEINAYETLVKAPFSVFLAARSDRDEQEFIAVGKSLTAHQVNRLLHFAAPTKNFGLDTRDIIMDWTDLYDPSQEKRKKAHARMPGWSQFESSRERVLGVLQRNWAHSFQSDGFDNQNEDDVIIPVLHWRKDAEGNSSIVLEPLDEGLQDALAQALPDQIKDTDRLDGGMGIMYLAAYSPEQTIWPNRIGYRHSGIQDTNFNGPTQVLAFVYRQIATKQAEKPKDPLKVREHEDIQLSPLLEGLGHYIETGEVPEIKVVFDASAHTAENDSSPVETEKLLGEETGPDENNIMTDIFGATYVGDSLVEVLPDGSMQINKL